MAYTFTSRYYYANGKLMRMSWGANIVDFFYDESGLPYAITWDFNPGDKFYDSETRYFAVGKS